MVWGINKQATATRKGVANDKGLGTKGGEAGGTSRRERKGTEEHVREEREGATRARVHGEFEVRGTEAHEKEQKRNRQGTCGEEREEKE